MTTVFVAEAEPERSEESIKDQSRIGRDKTWEGKGQNFGLRLNVFFVFVFLFL